MTISLPDLPMRCLKTAEDRTTTGVIRGRNTIIDFWTTKCTRCPAALDRLERKAQDPQYVNVQFVSICCDKLDGAREIIEKDDDLRWPNVSHYFMEAEDKEYCKRVLGFKAVPFYVILNNSGGIEQMGGTSKIDFSTVPGKIVCEEDKENARLEDSPVKSLEAGSAKRVFVLDELDF